MFNSMKNFVKAVPAEYVEKTSKFTSRVLDSVQQSLDSTSHSLTSRNMCNKCNSPITVLSLRVFQSSRCCLCGCTFCGNCLQKAQAEVPEELLHDDFLPKGKSAEAIASSKQKVLLICIGECSILYKASQVEKFRKDIDEKFGVLLAEFLNNPYEQKLFFPRPDPSQDSTFRRALRFAVIAEVAADFAGYSMIFQAVKYTFYSSELVRHLIGVDIMPLLNPLLNSLKEYNITGPTALLSLYYLSCQHTLEFKMKTLPTVLPKEDTSGAVKGLLTASCPDSVLHYLRRFVAPAQWLYISLLPSPHHTVDWSSWYMSHIIKRQGWTVVMAINEATQLPNGFKCPAFALVTRCRRAGRQYGKKDSSIVPVQLKEAMLIIRGTKTTMDWTINLDDSSINFSYYSFNQSNEASGGYTVVDGHVHKGMYEAAIGILQSYNLRRYILQLCNDNYDVKIVGHSLGAGVAALIAAEMRNSLFFISSSSLKSHTEGSQIADDMAIAGTSNITPSSVRRMAAICFSSPSCVSENLAERWLNDELLLNVVYGNDLVPRLNRQNCARLAEELKKFAPTANEWLKKDKKAFYNYVSTLGKASDMAELVESPVQASKAMVAEKDNPEQSSESEALSLVDPELPMVAEQPQLSTVDLGEVSENLEDLQSFQANPDLDSNKLQEDAAGGGIILVTPSPIVHIRQNFDGTNRLISLDYYL